MTTIQDLNPVIYSPLHANNYINLNIDNRSPKIIDNFEIVNFKFDSLEKYKSDKFSEAYFVLEVDEPTLSGNKL